MPHHDNEYHHTGGADRAAADLADYVWRNRPAIPGQPLRLATEGRYARAWARVLIERGRQAGPLPLFGSAQWCQLADDDPRKAASAIRAALAWLREGDDLAFALAREDYERRRADDEYWSQRYAERRQIVDGLLEDIRVRESRDDHARQANERARRGRDYPGGPVDFWTGHAHTEEGAA
ncbi:hypothetical protein GCM10009799_03050 [Nocardiopsis rhodophaea]|uniref:Uncharacterized protein n=1 Tax=Nocardiopsis rhodophaea TaxID=280238 RepID=A0ABN2S6U7_9ACTN